LALVIGILGLLWDAGLDRAQSVPMSGSVAGVATIEYGLTTHDASGDLAIPVESRATG
jgi:hypothetical protein